MDTKVAALIIAFNNSKGLDNVLTALHSQKLKASEIVVIDNASTDDTNSMVKEKYPDVTYIRLDENVGSAGGYYEGIKYAAVKNDVIWTLDDDLTIFPDTLLKLVETFEYLKTIENVGGVRCTVYPDTRSYYEAGGFAWRGTLLNSEAVKKIGYPNKDYYLYAEDVEYSMRMYKAGYKVFYVTASKMAFTRPNQTVYNVLGLKTSFYNDPDRLYYSIRNSTATFIKYILIIQLFYLIGYSLKILLCLIKYPLKNKDKFLSAILLGFFHGITSKLGKYNRFVPEATSEGGAQ